MNPRSPRWWFVVPLAMVLGCGGTEETQPAPTPEGEVKTPTNPVTPSGDNGAPVLSPIGDRVVAVGQSLVITMEATDPDGDTLTYTITGELPEGARFIKNERRFEWTPEVVGEVSYLTFVVTDGTEFDRETVRIEVTAGETNLAPSLSPVGDQVATVGTELQIQLWATDPNGDTLSYDLTGEVPGSAAFDPHQGLFRWTPEPDDLGQRQVVFSVSDGALDDSETVTLVVGSTADDGPSLPVFAPVTDQQAVVGELLGFQVSASGPGGEIVEVALELDPPPGSTLVSGLFSWTPLVGDLGQSWQVMFSATAGGLTAYLTVDILVVSGAQATKCSDDPGEPNGSIQEATPLEMGTLEASICDTTLVPVDSDIYVLTLGPAQTLGVTMDFDPLDGDLELEVVDGALTPLAVGNSVGGQESVSWTSPSGGDVYVVVYGIAQAVFHAPYTLTVTTEEGGPCTDDGYEPNDGGEEIPELPGPDEVLTLCPGDEDWWSVLLFCGETALFTLDAGGTGDLDMYLWDPENPGDGLVASGATGALVETLEVASVPHTGDYHLKVVGWPPGTGGGTYSLDVDYSGACFDQGVGNNHEASTAWPLDGAAGTLAEQRLCCEDDWYLLTMNAGQTGLVDVKVTSGGGSAGLTVYAPGGAQPIASGSPGDSGSLVEFQASNDGVYVIQVEGSAGTDYDLEWLVD